MAGQTDAKAGLTRGEYVRLWTLVLLLVLVAAAGWRFVGFAQNPQFQVHSDDLLWMRRFFNKPCVAVPPEDIDRSQAANLPEARTQRDNHDYADGMDQPALERWVCHYLLLATGKMPDSLPEKKWDYTKDVKWNTSEGNVAPADAVRFVRVVNAGVMIGAVILVYIALARSVTPMAGFVGGLYIVLHSSIVDVMWSIGSDPLMWFFMVLVLLLWVAMGETFWAAVAVGVAGGLAASAKLNGAFVLVGYMAWLAFRRKPLLAVLSGAVGLGVFIILDPIVFARGVTGVPGMLVELVKWRIVRAHLMTVRYYPVYADAPRWYVYFYLLGPWWALVPLLVAARRLWRLDAVVFWGLALLAGHLLTITSPWPRYTLPLQTGLVFGLIAAYWPRRAAAREIGRLFGRRQGA